MTCFKLVQSYKLKPKLQSGDSKNLQKPAIFVVFIQKNAFPCMIMMKGKACMGERWMKLCRII